MTIYEDKFCRISFENGTLKAESKALGATMESSLARFFTQNNTVVLDGVRYNVKIDSNDYAMARYFRFTCDVDSMPDWLLSVQYNYILKVENLSVLDRNIYNTVSETGRHKYMILIEDAENIDFLLDEGFFWVDYYPTENESYGYFRQYRNDEGYEIWITWAEYGRLKCGLPVEVEGTVIS